MLQKFIFLPPSNFSARKRIYLFPLLIFFSAFQSGYSQNAPAPVELELNKPLEREIAAKEKHNFQITLAENQFAFVTVEQRGIDVVARVFNKTDERAVAQKDLAKADGREEINFVASAAGVYRLEIEAKILPPVTGRYTVRLAETRPPTAKEMRLEEARKLQNESFRLWREGAFAEAKSVVERALEIREKESGAEDLDAAVSLAHLGLITTDLGDYEKGISIYRRSLQIREKILGSEHLELAAPLTNLGVLYRVTEDFENAEQVLRRAIEIRGKNLPPDNPLVATSFTALGNLLLDKGDADQALEFLQKASSIWEKSGFNHPNARGVLTAIGDAYKEKGDYKLAEAYYLRNLDDVEKNFGADHFQTANILGSLGVLYIAQEDYAKAEPLLRRTLLILEKAVGKEHRNYALALYQLAVIYTNTGEYQKAEPLYQEAIALTEKLFGAPHSLTLAYTNHLARNHQAKGETALALELLRRTQKLGGRIINLVLSTSSERQKLLYAKESLFQETNQYISTHLKFAPDNPAALELALTTIFESKGRVSDAMAADFAVLRGRFNREDQILLDKLKDATNQLARRILNESPNAEPEEFQKQIKDLEAQKERLEIEISRRSSEFRARNQAVTLASIRSAIPENAALIEFGIYHPYDPKAKDSKAYDEPRYVAYVVRRAGEIKWRDLGAAKTIDAAVETFRQALSDPKRKDVKLLARAVDEKVMQPVRDLTGDAAQLLISPDGALNLIPFEALTDERQNYLVENYSFTYLTSGRDLLRMQTARASKNKSLVIADPSFGAPPDERTARVDVRKNAGRRSVTAARNLSDTYFAPLGGTAQEARAIRTLFPDAEFLTADQATETALKQVVAPRILHVATHGFFLEDADEIKADASNRSLNADAKAENPLLRSGLALAGANRRDGRSDDGILTALEASGLNLWGTKLVVLSACDTGVGDVKNGEGVYGLRRAFVLAGTESLVMSLWSVSDSETRRLMTDYYKNLKTGMGRGAALRQAQLAMLKKENYQHPFYWAAFIQSGEWANLDGKR